MGTSHHDPGQAQHGVGPRLHLTSAREWACRICHATRRVTSTHHLPDHCEACGSGTWEENGRCGNWLECDAIRREGTRSRAHCHACGYSVWDQVRSRRGVT